MSSSIGSPESGLVYGAGVAVGSGVGSALVLGTASASGSGSVDGFCAAGSQGKYHDQGECGGEYSFHCYTSQGLCAAD